VLREKKGYGAKNSLRNFAASHIWEKQQERVYRCWIHNVDQLLKSRLIEEWEHFHQVFIDEAIRQWRPCLRACIQAHEGHFEHRLPSCL